MRINIRNHGAAIATGLACVGVIATSLLAAKKLPEAKECVQKRELERGSPLPPVELVKVAAPVCWPVAVSCAATLSCIVGIQALNRKQQASLVAAYGIAAQTLKKYEDKIKDLFGDEGINQFRAALAQDNAESIPSVHPTETCLFYDMLSERYFNSTMLDVRNAEYHFNRNFILRGGTATLNELYDFLGLEKIDGGDVAGWDICEMGDWYGFEWVDFDHELTKITSDSGEEMECCIISYPFPPCYLDACDGLEPVVFECAK